MNNKSSIENYSDAIDNLKKSLLNKIILPLLEWTERELQRLKAIHNDDKSIPLPK